MSQPHKKIIIPAIEVDASKEILLTLKAMLRRGCTSNHSKYNRKYNRITDSIAAKEILLSMIRNIDETIQKEYPDTVESKICDILNNSGLLYIDEDELKELEVEELEERKDHMIEHVEAIASVFESTIDKKALDRCITRAIKAKVYRK
jgi:hypothetical protein